MKRIIITFTSVMLVVLAFGQTGIKNEGKARLAPRLLNYQGYLTDTQGNPINNSSLSLSFAIFDSPSGGSQKWTETQVAASVDKGIFNVLLGSVTTIPDSVFTNNTNRWLELSVAGQTLSPRTQIVSSAYSYTSTYSDTAQYSRNAAPDNDWIFLISDGADTTLQMGGRWGLTRSGNVLYGSADSTHVNFGVACTTGRVGQPSRYCTVAGGSYNTASSSNATVSGGFRNNASGLCATVGGGWADTAKALYGGALSGYSNLAGDVYGDTGAVVSGGYDNSASAIYSFVGGGRNNTASGLCATVGGGLNNTADTAYATVGGGHNNIASGSCATVGGGLNNTADTAYATVGGGYNNIARNSYATVAGGVDNRVWGVSATVGGGNYNRADTAYATVGGGVDNIAGGKSATVGGGCQNNADSNFSTVAGGGYNTAGNYYATVAGGYWNNAGGVYTTMGGGYYNTVIGDYATVGGGYYNYNAGDFSVIAGGDHDTITATGDYSYLFGINSNLTQDSSFMVNMPHIWFGDEATGYEFPKQRGTDGQVLGANASGQLSWVMGAADTDWVISGSNMYSGVSGNVGIGTTTPRGKLDVDGPSDVWLVDDGLQSGSQNIFLPGHVFLIPRSTGKISYLQARRSDNSGSVEMRFRTYNSGTVTNAMHIDSVGNVGIGNMTPRYKLDVDGIICGGLNDTVKAVFGGILSGYSNLAGDNAVDTAAAVCAGYNNSALARFAFVGGGWDNTAGEYATTVSGGYSNTANNYYAAVGGGVNNIANGQCATVGGGINNAASGYYATMGGGNGNVASGYASVVAGGSLDSAVANYGGALSGYNNLAGDAAEDSFATVCGGLYNAATARASFIGGGRNNTARGYASTIGGGIDNDVGWSYATVGGGSYNSADSFYSTVGGGSNNHAYHNYATVAGGQQNIASSSNANIGGGLLNRATNTYATVGGGRADTASGINATVPGGIANKAAGDYSFAAGRRAKANNQGCFVWGDATDANVSASVDNRWVARCSGGVYFYTNSGLTSGAYLAAGGGSWTSVSDRNMKENFEPVDGDDVLAKLVAMPITTWNYKSQDRSIRHIGPMAQDFAGFGVGEDDKHITTIDADGIALAAIQELARQVQELKAENRKLQERIETLENK